MQRAAAQSPAQLSPQTPSSQTSLSGPSALSASGTPTQPPSKKARLASYASPATPAFSGDRNANSFSALDPDASADYVQPTDSPSLAESPFTPLSGVGRRESQWAFSYRTEDSGSVQRSGTLKVEALHSLDGLDGSEGTEQVPWHTDESSAGRQVFGELAGRREWVEQRRKGGAGVEGEEGEIEEGEVSSTILSISSWFQDDAPFPVVARLDLGRACVALVPKWTAFIIPPNPHHPLLPPALLLVKVPLPAVRDTDPSPPSLSQTPSSLSLFLSFPHPPANQQPTDSRRPHPLPTPLPPLPRNQATPPAPQATKTLTPRSATSTHPASLTTPSRNAPNSPVRSIPSPRGRTATQAAQRRESGTR